SFARAHEDRTHYPRAVVTSQTLAKRPPELPLLNQTLAKRPPELPLLNLRHLRRLTDGTGLVQHACFTVPNYDEGYTTDGNARDLMVAVSLEEQGEDGSGEASGLASRYLAFLRHAFNTQTGRFRNFLSYDRRWLEEKGSDDCQGRSLWALG